MGTHSDAGVIEGRGVTEVYACIIEGPFVTESLYASNRTVCHGRKT